MLDPVIWTRDDILRFTHEPDPSDRSWAWGWLHRHHAEEASRQAVRALRDPDDSVVSTGLGFFVSTPPSAEARGAIEELRARADLHGSLKEALDALDRPGRKRTFEDPIGDEIDRLSPLHDAVRRETPRMLRSGDLEPVLVALGALGHQQFQWATDILMDALPHLLTTGDPTLVWDTFEQLRDPRSLPALAAAWVPGERYVADLYVRIHRFSGATDWVPPGITRDAEEEMGRGEAARANRARDPEGASLEPRRLQLRCTACGRTGDYDFPAEALATVLCFDGAEKAGKALPAETIVLCKHCGVRNAYAINPLSMISAFGGVTALQKSRAKGTPQRGP